MDPVTMFHVTRQLDLTCHEPEVDDVQPVGSGARSGPLTRSAVLPAGSSTAAST